MRGSLFKIAMFIGPTASRAENAELPLQLEKASLTHVDLPARVLVEGTGNCIPIVNSELMLAAVYKSPGCARNDASIIELVDLQNNSFLAGDLNAKPTFWNRADSYTSGETLLDLFDVNEFEISAPQCSSHYSPAGRSDMLDIAVHQNVRLSEVIVSDVLDSDHLPIIFHIVDHIRTRNLWDPIEKFTVWERL
jgi:hypothetical protein